MLSANSINKTLTLLSQVLATARRDESGHVAWMRQTMEMQERTRASDEDADGFVRIARELAADRPALAAMRRSMRDQLRESALLDHRGFARKLDAIYRNMWREWCAAGAAGSTKSEARSTK